MLCHAQSHIANDECGAPEFFTGGARLTLLGGADAKIDPAQLAVEARRKAGDVHSMQPSCVSVTQATETGGVYTLDELRAIGAVAATPDCRCTWTARASPTRWSAWIAARQR